MSLAEKKHALDQAIYEARKAFRIVEKEPSNDARFDGQLDNLRHARQRARVALEVYLDTPSDPDPRLEPIPVGVHIGSKGCADRYKTNTVAPGERDKPQSCNCGPGKCWVTYARRQHEHKLPALTSDQWAQAGMPDPLPSTRIFPIKAKPRKRKKP